ncbi:MAG TPA: DUF1003 domain-containing protein [Polyangiaceae bacterium]|nr:DUF1003 domain-containing protein [Polyangiaceae bacterium]
MDAHGGSRARVPDHVSENIETIAELHAKAGSRVSRHQRAIEGFTRQLGRPGTLYLLVGASCAWALYNAAASKLGWPAVDRPPFYALQGLLSGYAAVVATTVLTAQNRQNRDAERRAHLELQVSLVAEQKASKIIALLEELRRDLPNVRNRRDAVAEALQETTHPGDVLTALEASLEEANADEGANEDAEPRDSGAGGPGSERRSLPPR